MTCHNQRRWIVGHPLARKLLWATFCLGCLLVLLSLGTWAMFRDLPGPSPRFDCDDAVLIMYQRLSGLGIQVTPIVGNLKVTGESYEQITHIWLLVRIGGVDIPLDWGKLSIDRQHYEGYAVSYQQVLDFVRQDALADTGWEVATGAP